jgi:hypothetical protein
MCNLHFERGGILLNARCCEKYIILDHYNTSRYFCVDALQIVDGKTEERPRSRGENYIRFDLKEIVCEDVN